APGGARGCREHRRRGPHFESRPRNPATDTGGKCAGVCPGGPEHSGRRGCAYGRCARQDPAMSEPNLHLHLNRERFEISEAFLKKYNRPGPRYTSYPTAPVWQDNFGPDDLEQFYAAANAAHSPVSLYMHLPFCESLCLFCACNVVISKNHSIAPPYIETLEREIEHISRFVSRDRPVVQFHWGGGTPTYL